MTVAPIRPVEDSNPALDAALAYIRLGWAVLPLKPSTKQPFGRLVPNGFHDATKDEASARAWWSAHPTAGIGIALQASGLVAVDIDPRNGGIDTIDQLEAKHGPIASDVHAFTGGGGEHRVFSAALVASLPGTLGPGVDLKADGYICAEPTIHPSGRAYAWEASSDPRDGVVPSTLPGWIRDLGRRPLEASIAVAATPAAPPINPRRLEDAKAALPHIPADDRDTWYVVGMAIHQEMPTQAGFDLWAGWSAKSSKFDPQDQLRVWNSFRRRNLAEKRVDMNVIFRRAQEHGWANGVVVKAEEPAPNDWAKALAEWKPRRGIATYDAPVVFAVDGLIQAGKVGALVAAGGTGKTTVVLILAISIATGRPFFGHEVKRGSFVLLSNDDAQEDLDAALSLVGRAMRLGRDEWVAVEEKVRVLSLQGLSGTKTFTIPDHGAAIATGVEQTILEAVEGIPDLVGIALDTLRQFSGGNANDEIVIKHTVSGATDLALRSGAFVLFPHHTGKANYREGVTDMYAGSGSAALADNCRFVLLLQAATWGEVSGKVQRTGQEDGEPLVLTSTRGSLRVKQPDPIYLVRSGYAVSRLKGFTLSAGQVADKRDREILQAVRDGHQTKNAVFAVVGGKRASVQNRIDELEALGFLVRGGGVVPGSGTQKLLLSGSGGAFLDAQIAEKRGNERWYPEGGTP